MQPDLPSLRPPPAHRGLRGFLGVHPLLVAAGTALLAVPWFADFYWTLNLTSGLILAVSCLGLLVLVGWARQISLMQAGLTGSATYLCQWAFAGTTDGVGLGWPFPLAVAGVIAFAVAVSLLAASVCVRLAGPYVVVLTLAVQFWLENSVMVDQRVTGGNSDRLTPRPDFFGHRLVSDSGFYYLVLGVLFVVVVFLHRARYSRFGRSMILAGSDPEAAACAGVSPWRYRVWAFVVAGTLAGLAGALSGPLHSVPPGTLEYMSFSSMAYLAVPVLAGFDSIAGAVAVAVLLTLVPLAVLSWGLNLYLLCGCAMAVGAVLGPRGLGGWVSDRLDRRW